MADRFTNASQAESAASEPAKQYGTVAPVERGENSEQKKSTWRRWLVGLVWDSVEGDARNRRYVQKLDNYLLFVSIFLGLQFSDGLHVRIKHLYLSRVLY
jgi:hypothetical protein